MRIQTFIDRPILACVISVVILILGSIALSQLPIEHGGLTMPEIALELGINKSSVSRAIGRAKTRIERSMKYAMQMNVENY